MAIKKDGKTLTPRQLKAQVMKWTGWSSEEYSRQYDLLRLRVRTYERVTGSKERRNVSEVLAREARRQYYSKGRKKPLERSSELSQILSTPAASTRAKVAQSTQERIQSRAYTELENRFGGFIHKAKYSDAIQAEVEKAKADGTFNAGTYRDIVLKYIRQWDEERASAKTYNAGAPAASYIFPHSR